MTTDDEERRLRLARQQQEARDHLDRYRARLTLLRGALLLLALLYAALVLGVWR